MLSPVKIAILSFLFFGTIALVVRTSESQPQDPKALISSTNIALERALLPLSSCYSPPLRFARGSRLLPFLAYVTSANATEGQMRPVINEVVVIVAELTSGLRESSLSSCAGGCTQFDIVELIAITIKVLVILPLLTFSSSHTPISLSHRIICEPLGNAYRLYPSFGALLSPTRLV